MEIDLEEDRQKRNEHNSAAEPGERSQKARSERACPYKEGEFGNVHPSVCHSYAETEHPL